MDKASDLCVCGMGVRVEGGSGLQCEVVCVNHVKFWLAVVMVVVAHKQVGRKSVCVFVWLRADAESLSGRNRLLGSRAFSLFLALPCDVCFMLIFVDTTPLRKCARRGAVYALPCDV